MNQISIKFIGDSNLCAKYLALSKNKANELASQTKDNLNKIYKYPEILDGKACDVYIIITLSLPSINITIKTELRDSKSKTNFLSSGLSINEINQNEVFSQFYPKLSEEGFIDYAPLYRSTELDNYYGFFKTKQGNNINQNHYLFGSQFTGLMAEQVQYLLGSTDIDIKYRFDWYETNGLYEDSQKNWWLITLNSNGVNTRQLTLSTQLDNTIKQSEGVIKKPISVSLVDGLGYQSEDVKLINLSSFYDGIPLSSNQGWSFNKNGSKIRNTTYKTRATDSYIEYATYEITINEINTNNTITLSANLSITETGNFIPHNYVNFLFPKFGGIAESYFYPEQNNILNNSQVKYGPLLPRFFYHTPIEDLPIGNSKIPLITFFNENDEVQNYYYSYEKVNKVETIESSTGFTSVNDFSQSGGIKIGDLTINNTNNNSNYDFTFKHGILINNDISNLIEDSLGDNTEEYKFSIDNGGSINNFAYKVINNQLPVDLRDYQQFFIKSDIEDINALIEVFQGLHNNFNDYFKNTKLEVFSTNPAVYSTYYELKQQMSNVNYWLNQNDTNNELYRLIEVSEIKNINKIFKNLALNINFAPFLYEIDNNILSVFETLDSTYLNNIKSTITDINNSINTQLIVNKDYYINLIQSFKNNILDIKTITDISKINKIQLNNLINDINTELKTINTIFIQINNIITTINNKIESLNDYNSKVDIYNNAIKTYFNNNRVNYNGLDLVYKAEVLTSNDGVNKTYDKYYASSKYYNAIFKQINIIKNRKLTHFSIIFNYSTRNSLTVYNQTDTYEDIIYGGSYEKETYNSNEFALYKQTEFYTNDIKTDSTDYIFIEEIKNFKRYYFTGLNASNIIVDIGLNFLDDNTTNLKYVKSSSLDFKDLIVQNFTNISKDFTYYHSDVNRMNVLLNNYEINKESIIKVFNQEILTINTEIKDNVLLFPYNQSNTLNQFNYILNKDKYNLQYNYDGMIYFNFIKDSNTYNYVVSKDIYGYQDNKEVLTNISKYNIIDSEFVNFIGKPFDIE